LLYKIRGLLRRGAEHLTERQRATLIMCLHGGDPNDEVALRANAPRDEGPHHGEIRSAPSPVTRAVSPASPQASG